MRWFKIIITVSTISYGLLFSTAENAQDRNLPEKKNATDKWDILWQENENTSNCSWKYIQCNDGGRISKLDFSSTNMTGSIPREIGLLKELEELHLSGNRLTGDIPSELATLKNLIILDLSGNKLDSSIPTEIGKLVKLSKLYFNSTNITGSIPREIGLLEELEELDLSRNQLTGGIHTELTLLKKLKILDLSRNKLSKSIPTEIGKLGNLKDLNLARNDFEGGLPTDLGMLISLTSLNTLVNDLSGPIPSEFGVLTDLVYLDIASNVITGTIPKEIGNLRALVYLFLEENAITGVIPTELGNLETLSFLEIDINAMTGQILTEIGKLSNLQDLNLGKNEFAESIPTELGLLTDLEFLDLSSNQITGSIPKEVGNLRFMRILFVEENAITGLIPTELGHLEFLTFLDIGSNALTGQIPTEIGMITSLELLLINSNQLTSSIPTEIRKLENLLLLSMENNRLSGKIPTELRMLKTLVALSANSNKLTGSIPTEIGELKNLLSIKLGANNLTGEIPTDFQRTKLLELHLYDNRLIGQIPLELGELEDVQVIDVSSNQLTGSIPTEFGNLPMIDLDLSSNNLTGCIPSEIGTLKKLTSLKLRSNQLVNKMPTTLGLLNNLTDLDLSSNHLSGPFPTELRNLVAIRELNISFNQVTGDVQVDLFQNLQPIDSLDLSHNHIRFELDSTFLESLWRTQKVILTGNKIEGSLEIPKQISKIHDMLQLHLGGNCLTGTLPSLLHDIIPEVIEIDLSSGSECSKQCFKKSDCENDGSKKVYCCGQNRGICFKERDFHKGKACTQLSIHGQIPLEYAYFGRLKKLNLSGNALSGTIPRRLGLNSGLPALQELDLSYNDLSGDIPIELGRIGSFTNNDVAIRLAGNDFRTSANAGGKLAPYSLCKKSTFDLNAHNKFCPPDRLHLKAFFKEAKGMEWTLSANWGDEYKHPCEGWHGVRCDTTNTTVTGLTLVQNGLSGKLSPSLGRITSLEMLDLHNNNIKGKIPSEIGNLASLQQLNLCYNELIGEIPIDLKNITKNLMMLRLHGNRLRGMITGLEKARLVTKDSSEDDLSRYIADCGYPSELEQAVGCKECTICCNSEGYCESRFSQDANILFPILKDHYGMSYFVFFLLVLASCITIFTVSSFVVKSKWPEENDNLISRWLGEDSVYILLLGDNWIGWAIAVGIVLAQLLAFYVFYKESYLDFENEDYQDNAWLYSWECDRDKAVCEKEFQQSTQGWIVFAILMVLHLTPDLYGGIKILWAAPRMRSVSEKLRCFIGGTFLIVTAVFAIGVSVFFNFASAGSNTDLIISAVILLFINDFDELCFRILAKSFPNLVIPKKCGEISLSENSRIDFVDTLDELHLLKKENAEMLKKINALSDMYVKFSNEIEILKSKEKTHSSSLPICLKAKKRSTRIIRKRKKRGEQCKESLDQKDNDETDQWASDESTS